MMLVNRWGIDIKLVSQPDSLVLGKIAIICRRKVWGKEGSRKGNVGE